MIDTIRGSGGRVHATEQAASLLHLADELAADLRYWRPHLAEAICTEVQGRIQRLRAQAAEYELAVILYDRLHA